MGAKRRTLTGFRWEVRRFSWEVPERGQWEVGGNIPNHRAGGVQVLFARSPAGRPAQGESRRQGGERSRCPSAQTLPAASPAAASPGRITPARPRSLAGGARARSNPPSAVAPHPGVRPPVNEWHRIPDADPDGHDAKTWGSAGWRCPVPHRENPGRGGSSLLVTARVRSRRPPPARSQL